VRKADVFRPYRPYIVDAPTAAYLLCMSVSAFHEYVRLGFLPKSDADFGNLQRWRWDTLVEHIERNKNIDTSEMDDDQDPYLEAIKNGAKKGR
jgi:hypothetical protein